MITLMVLHEVDDVEHWLASPKREELFGPLGIKVRPFRDPQGSNRIGLIVETPDLETWHEALQSGPGVGGDEARRRAPRHDSGARGGVAFGRVDRRAHGPVGEAGHLATVGGDESTSILRQPEGRVCSDQHGEIDHPVLLGTNQDLSFWNQDRLRTFVLDSQEGNGCPVTLPPAHRTQSWRLRSLPAASSLCIYITTCIIMTTRMAQHPRKNVFRELGFDVEESGILRIKSDLMIELSGLIERRAWTQAQAAEVMEVTQPRISNLVCGKIDLFSIDTLITMLDRAGVRVEVTTSPREVA